MSQPILSIITPVLNAQQHLRAFLQSVVDQRCAAIEHILVDGASADNSLKIIEEFGRQYPAMRWISEKDSYPEEAINKGIALARGPFVGLLCIDDFYEPNTLNEVVELLPTLPHPVFLVGNCNLLNEKDELFYINKPEALSTLGMLMNREFPNSPSAYFYHKDLHQKIGFYTHCKQSDVDFLLRAFEVAKVHYVDKCWGNFRRMPGSITVTLEDAGKLNSGEREIFQRHLMTYPLLKRIFIRMLVAIGKRPKLFYFSGRIKHYFHDPKDILRLLKKMVGYK